MDLIHRHVWRHPLFHIGLIIRGLLILLAAPQVSTVLFVPFLRRIVDMPSVDPWATHLAQGGLLAAFPYGAPMYILLSPGVLIGNLLDILVGVDVITQIGFGISILIADYIMLLLLFRLADNVNNNQIFLFYWISPLVIYVNYWHGQTDIVPMAILVWAFLFLQQLKIRWSGVLLGLAIATKLSMILPVPFMLIYLYRNKRLRDLFFPFVASMVLTVLLVQGPFLLSSSVRHMLLDNQEFEKIYDLSIPFKTGNEIYVLIFVYVFMMNKAWSLPRISFDLMTSLITLAFFSVLLLTPASPGWILWVVPFLVLQNLRGSKTTTGLFILFSLLYITFNLMHASGAYLPLFDLDLSAPLSVVFNLQGYRLESICMSLMITCGLLLALRIGRDGLKRNDYFGLTQRPLVVGVAGDSSTGKDTLAGALQDLFGGHSVAAISGDDYHLWDRHKPMWQIMTHLNPRANDLHKFTQDILALASGRQIQARHYDHKIGRMTRPMPIRSNDVLIASGLHALYPPILRACYDVKIYMDMDEGLRRFFKIQRDVHVRGHSRQKVEASITARLSDAERYIHPQKQWADIIFSLCPADSVCLDSFAITGNIPMKLVVKLRHALFYEELLRVLIGICGLRVDVKMPEQDEILELTIEGETQGEDIKLAATGLIYQLDELLDRTPVWQDGLTGVMQLITIAQSAQTLRSRIA